MVNPNVDNPKEQILWKSHSYYSVSICLLIQNSPKIVLCVTFSNWARDACAKFYSGSRVCKWGKKRFFFFLNEESNGKKETLEKNHTHTQIARSGRAQKSRAQFSAMGNTAVNYLHFVFHHSLGKTIADLVSKAISQHSFLWRKQWQRTWAICCSDACCVHIGADRCVVITPCVPRQEGGIELDEDVIITARARPVTCSFATWRGRPVHLSSQSGCCASTSKNEKHSAPHSWPK